VTQYTYLYNVFLFFLQGCGLSNSVPYGPVSQNNSKGVFRSVLDFFKGKQQFQFINVSFYKILFNASP
jgi:hypothetical protein